MTRRYVRRYIDRDFAETLPNIYPEMRRSMVKMTRALHKDVLLDLRGGFIGQVFGKMRSKKGSFFDVAYYIGAFFLIAVVALFATKAFSAFSDGIQNVAGVDADTKSFSSSISTKLPGLFDGAILIGFFLGILLIFFLASMVSIHPFFFIPYFLLVIAFIYGSAAISNSYETMAENADLVAQASQFTFLSHIMAYLPFIIGIVSFMLAIFMYKNYKEGAAE